MLGLLFSKTSFKILQMVGVAFVLLYAYDYLFKKPIRDVTASYDVKINELNDEVVTKNQVIKNAGILIGKLNQKVYDLNRTIVNSKLTSDINISNCKDSLLKLKGDISDAKIDNSRDDFYIKYAF